MQPLTNEECLERRLAIEEALRLAQTTDFHSASVKSDGTADVVWAEIPAKSDNGAMCAYRSAQVKKVFPTARNVRSSVAGSRNLRVVTFFDCPRALDLVLAKERIEEHREMDRKLMADRRPPPPLPDLSKASPTGRLMGPGPNLQAIAPDLTPEQKALSQAIKTTVRRLMSKATGDPAQPWGVYDVDTNEWLMKNKYRPSTYQWIKRHQGGK